MKTKTTCLLPFLLWTAASAQEPEVLGDPIAELVTAARAREAVTWLAADERGGRDTPSPGLEAAAQWLAERYAAAGLRPLRRDHWFHDYSEPGMLLDPATISLRLVRAVHGGEQVLTLEPGRDVRLWRAGDAVAGEAERCTVAVTGLPVLRSALWLRAGRRPVIVEVGEDHPYWEQAAGARRVPGRPLAASRPVFLVREGILPPLPADGREPEWFADWAVPAPERVDVPLVNVVGLLPGTELREEYVVVSAHYDHLGCGVPVDGDAIFNGADDDASGTAAVVLIAEALAQLPPPRRSVLFVCFSGEERGLLGSRAFLEHPPVPREQLVADVNIEMIGRPEQCGRSKAWVTGSELSDFAAVAAEAMARRGVELVDHRMAPRLFMASDNASFVRHGVVAHSISAGSLHRDYHRPSDESGKLDYEHMAAVTRGICELVLELANREGRLQWNEAGQARIGRYRK